MTEEVITHSHGADGEHAHEALAFTTWLDLSLAAMQAESIFKALSRKRPEVKAVFSANYQQLKRDLLALHDQLTSIVSRDPTQPVLFSHPVYDYLTAAYGINARSLHWEPDQVPSNDQLRELNNLRAEHPARWLVWEGEPLDLSIDKLKAAGISSTVYDPCGNAPSSGDFMSIMRGNVGTLEIVYNRNN
jgi:zinc transport system substrate-binding protein